MRSGLPQSGRSTSALAVELFEHLGKDIAHGAQFVKMDLRLPAASSHGIEALRNPARSPAGENAYAHVGICAFRAMRRSL
jgi:hypothetical protein